MDFLLNLFKSLVEKFQTKSPGKFMFFAFAAIAVYLGVDYALTAPGANGECCILKEVTVNLYIVKLQLFQTLKGLLFVVVTVSGLQLPAAQKK